jgi:protein phosphatase
MKYELKSYSIWEFGQRKDAAGNPHQEDSIFPAQGAEKPSDRLFILCDGMGGHDAGEVASATVCEAMSADILARRSDAEGEFTDEDFLHALDAAYDALDKHDNDAVKKMGTTMTFLKLHQGGATVAHLGDSRVYHIRPGKTGDDTQICFVTEDHSLVNDLVRAGEITHEEARHSKQKNIITRAMQPGQERRCKADIHHITDIRPNDYFYLCSDGMLEQDEMEDGTSLRNIFSDEGPSPEDKVRILIGATDENRDNHSALIIHITRVIDALPQEPPTDAQPEESSQEVKEEAPLSLTKHVAEVEADQKKDAPNLQTKKSHRFISRAMKLFLLALVLAFIAVIAWHYCTTVITPEATQ